MASGKAKGERGQVQYHLERVDELPIDEAARGMKYYHLLQPVMEDPGTWYAVATFSTDSGAGVVKAAIDEGKRKIPPGKWEFETRRVSDNAKRVSKLYARYIGPDE
jgi:hypothetical protein